MNKLFIALVLLISVLVLFVYGIILFNVFRSDTFREYQNSRIQAAEIMKHGVSGVLNNE